jgi:excinuclease ABC subunit C
MYKQNPKKKIRKVKNQKSRLKKQAETLPSLPGIYKMVDEKGVVIYIGKAKCLKARVSSYFSKTHHDTKTRIMVDQVVWVDTIITHSENEALILERQLIKNSQPKYNVLLKDDTHFPYIKVTKEPFPKIVIVREKKKDGARYYGPYPSMGSTRYIYRLLSDLFQLRECKQMITVKDRQPKCILLDIGQCLGPCIIKTVMASYQTQVEHLHLLLTGQRRTVQRQLKEKMNAYASELKFEAAAKYRDYLDKIEQITQRQTVAINVSHPIHVWVTAENETQLYILVQEMVQGQLIRQQGYPFQKTKDTSVTTVIEQAILNNSDHQLIAPKEILVESDIEIDAMRIIKTYFSPIKIHVPQKGVRKSVLERAKINATIALKQFKRNETEKTPRENGLESVQKEVSLSRRPTIIWGFDISHIQGTTIVASSVCFDQGKPDKSQYRQFNIKTVSGQSDDCRSMKEVVSRRVQLAFECQDTLPDLILIDGGKGQLNFAMQALHQLGVDQVIDCISLAKRDELIFKPGQSPIKLPHSNPGLQLLQRVRDEAHRFAIAYQRKKRSKLLMD